MNTPEQIICKPTPWFKLRALAMLTMFSVFSVLFYIDGTTGYREKNLEYYLHATFKPATEQFTKMKQEGNLTPEKWKEFASQQYVDFPDDRSLLPADIKLPVKWPDILTDYEKVSPLQFHLLWQEYSAENEMSNNVKKEPFDAGEIREQFIVLYICLTLSLITLFFLIRTSRRSISADNNALFTANGKRVPYENMKSLDLRKWDTKGIALIEYEGESGSGRVRIDGLTYGGFKKETGEPAEELMRKIRANFSGEIIEYTAIEEVTAPDESKENE